MQDALSTWLTPIETALRADADAQQAVRGVTLREPSPMPCGLFYRFGPMKFEPCVASWQDFVGACQSSEKPVVHQRLIASMASSHKVQD